MKFALNSDIGCLKIFCAFAFRSKTMRRKIIKEHKDLKLVFLF